MKFAKPIAEIERFTLKDVISASTTETTESAYDTPVWEDGLPCNGTANDYYTEGDCILL